MSRLRSALAIGVLASLLSLAACDNGIEGYYIQDGRLCRNVTETTSGPDGGVGLHYQDCEVLP